MFDKFHEGVRAWWPSTATRKRPSWPTWGCTRCSIGARRARNLHHGWPAGYSHKSMGHVADIFTSPVLATLPGGLAIGPHALLFPRRAIVVLLNAQPFFGGVQQGAGGRGAQRQHHNPNRARFFNLRRRPERRGAIFRHRSDTEAFLHLLAPTLRSGRWRLAARCAAATRRRGFSLVFLRQDRVIVARDPHGFRPRRW